VSERLRIALIGPTHPYKGGIAQHTTELAHRLAAAGHDVELLSWSAQYPERLYPGRQRVPGGRPETTPYPRTSFPLSWRRPDGWWRTGRTLRRADVVVLVVVAPVQVPAYVGILAGLGRRRRRGPRVVAICHNVLPHEAGPLDRPLVRAVLSRVDVALVHSAEQAALAAGLTAAPVRDVPLPFHPPATGSPGNRERGTRHRLLFFGLVRPYKGVDVLLRALTQVPGVALTVAGEVWAPLDGLVAELGLADRVEVLGRYVDAAELPGLFDAADALVLPYRSGTATQNVALAHAHGLPVVASDIPALAADVRDGVDGLLARPDDPADLARALRELYAPGRLEELTAAVRPLDPGPGWSAYVRAVTAPVGGEPAGRTGDDIDDATRHEEFGRAREVAKQVAERALWLRVGAQRAVESRTRRRAPRPVPDVVAPTAVLGTRADYERAVREARRLRLPLHPDRPKNWDALGALATVLTHCGRDARVLDAGSARYSCLLPWLRLYGARDLVGINLEFGAEVRHGPVRFRHGDATATGAAPGSFDAVTCLSVIEHGVPIEPFLAEAARVLRPGGVLSVSTDYAFDPPDTRGRTAYGAPVRIFGPADIRDLVATAARHGLRLLGELQLEHPEVPVHWRRIGVDYTFILLGFRREGAAE
jgi:glycosyltransferase involved in cell wall biosynthesis/SAM-dependent methyltransferase